MPVTVARFVDRSQEWWQELYERSRSVRIARKLPTFAKYYPPDDPYYLRIPGPHTEGYTDANPFKILRIPPDDIEYCSHRPYVRWRNAGKVRSGDWDATTLRFADASFYEGIDASFYGSLEAHFEDGAAWEDTPFIRDVLQRIEAGEAPWECATPADVRRRCARMDRLYADIRENGYKSQRELLAADGGIAGLPTDSHGLLALAKRHTILGRDEIAVDVGRDGAFLFYDSKNRLALAKLLDLEEIPVRVVVRHAEWQARRNQIRRTGGRESEAVAHPDLRELDRAESSGAAGNHRGPTR